ncbi:MAG: TRAP transporter small permease [Dehalobacterium sp.]
MLSKPIYAVSKLIHWVAVIVVGLMALPVVADVLSRILFDKSILGMLEITEFAMVLIVFGAIAYTQMNKGHIDIDILVSSFSQKTQELIDVFNYIIGVSVYTILAWQLYIQIGIKGSLLSNALGLPVALFVAAAAIGMTVFAAVLLLDLLNAVSKVLKNGYYLGLIIAVLCAAFIMGLPAVLDFFSIKLSGLAMGSLGFLLMFILLMFRLPIATGMAFIGLVGMIAITGRPTAALGMAGIAPYASNSLLYDDGRPHVCSHG